MGIDRIVPRLLSLRLGLRLAAVRVTTLKAFACLSFVLALAPSAHADFSYRETIRLTGGALLRLSSTGGRVAFPANVTVSFKDGKMLYATQISDTIVDLDAHTITSIDLEQKTYSLMSFDQMQATRITSAARSGPEGGVTVEVSNGAATQQLLGLPTAEKLLDSRMIILDARSGNRTETDIHVDAFIASGIDGAVEIRNFMSRLFGMEWAPDSLPGMSRPELVKGLGEVYQTLGTLNGLPLATKLTVYGVLPPGPGSGPALAIGAGKAGAIAAARDQRRQQPQESNQALQAANSNPRAILEATAVITSYSHQPLEASLFQIPSGYARVAPPSE